MKRIVSFLLSACVILGLCACGKKADVKASSNVSTWQEQYDLGVRYLSEGNYEEAIIAFTTAIEIDPKQENAYIGLSNAYIETGNLEKAEEVLENAAAAIGETNKLQVAKEELQKLIVDKNINSPDSLVESQDDSTTISENSGMSAETDSELEQEVSPSNPSEPSAQPEPTQPESHTIPETVITQPSQQEESRPSEEPAQIELEEQPHETGPYSERYDFANGNYYIYEYDAAGILEVETFYDANDTKVRMDEYYSNGNKKRSTGYYNNEIPQIIYEYRENGTAIRTTSNNSDGTVKLVREYDEAGKQLRSTFYNTDGSVKNIIEYQN